jgi:hypothetical protein
VPSESCPYCGEMTAMVQDPETKVFKSGICEHCKKDLAVVAASVPELKEEKPDMKAPNQEVLP